MMSQLDCCGLLASLYNSMWKLHYLHFAVSMLHSSDLVIHLSNTQLKSNNFHTMCTLNQLKSAITHLDSGLYSTSKMASPSSTDAATVAASSGSSDVQMVVLNLADISGAKLEPPFEKHTRYALRFWLVCRGINVPSSSTKGAILTRYDA